MRTRSFTGPGYAVFWRRRGEDSTYSYSTVYVNDRFADGTNTTGAWLDQFTIVKPGAGPVITTHPVSQPLQFTDPLALEATVTGSGPLRIQWFRDDILISDKPASSPGTQTFSAPAAAYLPGAYHVEATDSEGRMGISDDAIVSVDGNPGSLANLAGAVGYPGGN